MTSSRLRAISWLAAACVACTLWAQPLGAQPSAADLETARALYKEGKALREEGKVREAREKLKAAHALGQTPITGLELAKTHAVLGELVEAREVCLGIARIPVASDETDRSAAARSEAAQLAESLKPRIPSLIVRVPAGHAFPNVVVDGQPIPVAALGQLRKVNPGRHDVTSTFADGRQSKVLVEVREGETAEVNVPLPPPGAAVVSQPPAASAQAAAAPTEPPPAPSRRGMPGYAWAGFSIAVAGFAVGSVTGLLSMSKSRDLETSCPNHQCPPASHQELDDAKKLGTLSNVAFGAGAIGLILGVTGAIVGASERPAPAAPGVSGWIGPGSIGLKGAF